MSAFRKHLDNVHDKLKHPQASAMYESTKSTQSLEDSIRGVASGPLNEARKQDSGGYGFKKLKGQHEDAAGAAAVGGKKKKAIAEETFANYLNDYFGGELNESTSDDDILEAVGHLFDMEAMVAEYNTMFPQKPIAKEEAFSFTDAFKNLMNR